MSKPHRTIVITGAISGFGAAAVRAFADRCGRVWGTMRDIADRNATKKVEFEGYSPRITIAEMDVTKDASVTEGFAARRRPRSVSECLSGACRGKLRQAPHTYRCRHHLGRRRGEAERPLPGNNDAAFGTTDRQQRADCVNSVPQTPRQPDLATAIPHTRTVA